MRTKILTAITRAVSLLLALALFASAEVCRAEQSVDDERPVAHARPERREEPAATSEWYGLPFVFVDSYALLAMVAGGVAHNEGLTIGGLFAGSLNGLTWHLASNPMVPASWLGLGKGVLSATLRLGIGGLACLAGTGCNEMTTSATLRFALGIGAGMLIDWLFLTYRRIEPARRSRGWSVVPWAAPRALGLELSRPL